MPPRVVPLPVPCVESQEHQLLPQVDITHRLRIGILTSMREVSPELAIKISRQILESFEEDLVEEMLSGGQGADDRLTSVASRCAIENVTNGNDSSFAQFSGTMLCAFIPSNSSIAASFTRCSSALSPRVQVTKKPSLSSLNSQVNLAGKFECDPSDTGTGDESRAISVWRQRQVAGRDAACTNNGCVHTHMFHIKRSF